MLKTIHLCSFLTLHLMMILMIPTIISAIAMIIVTLKKYLEKYARDRQQVTRILNVGTECHTLSQSQFIYVV
jgi:hypothetical protein